MEQAPPLHRIAPDCNADFVADTCPFEVDGLFSPRTLLLNPPFLILGYLVSTSPCVARLCRMIFSPQRVTNRERPRGLNPRSLPTCHDYTKSRSRL